MDAIYAFRRISRPVPTRHLVCRHDPDRTHRVARAESPAESRASTGRRTAGSDLCRTAHSVKPCAYSLVSLAGEVAVSVSVPSPHRELHALLAVVEDGRRDAPGEGMPWVVLDGLLRLVPADLVGFHELDLNQHRSLLGQTVEAGGQRSSDLPAWDDDPHCPFWLHYWAFHPASYPARTGDLSSVLRWSDFYTDGELKNAPLYADCFRPYGYRHWMGAALPAPPGRTRRLLFWRGTGPDFSNDDQAAVQLLRPHLNEIYLEAERRRAGIPYLTRREREVLTLAARGHSNAEIARILSISVATVRKHMEHIFDRTGVRTRALAVAVALPHLSPSPQG